MKKICLLLIVLSCVCTSWCFSQIKFEKEYRIAEQSVPPAALDFIRKAALGQAVKWYIEQSQEGKSYEAKTVTRKNQLSIEFDQNGRILDIEKKLNLRELTSEKANLIMTALTQRFKRYKIKKLQAHWNGSEESLLAIVSEGSNSALATHYEIVLRSKTDKEHYEVFLNTTGQIEKVLKIRPGNFDNLEY